MLCLDEPYACPRIVVFDRIVRLALVVYACRSVLYGVIGGRGWPGGGGGGKVVCGGCPKLNNNRK